MRFRVGVTIEIRRETTLEVQAKRAIEAKKMARYLADKIASEDARVGDVVQVTVGIPKPVPVDDEGREL